MTEQESTSGMEPDDEIKPGDIVAILDDAENVIGHGKVKWIEGEMATVVIYGVDGISGLPANDVDPRHVQRLVPGPLKDIPLSRLRHPR